MLAERRFGRSEQRGDGDPTMNRSAGEGVRRSCVGLLGTGDLAGVTARQSGADTPRTHRAHDPHLMSSKEQRGREANYKSPWGGGCVK